MSRWPVLTASSTILLAGCAPAVQPGLANAPWLGSTGLDDAPPHDVIANGDEGCGRYGEQGPLRGRIRPCTSIARGAAPNPWLLSPAVPPPDGLVVPWLQHFYVGWPCPHPARSSSRSALWSPTTVAEACVSSP
jgi:hypothetical protein